MPNIASEPIAPSLDLDHLSTALQTAAAAVEQFAARVAQSIGLAPTAANGPTIKLQAGADQMTAAFQRGNAKLADFSNFVGRAGAAVQGFAGNLAKVGQAQFGQLFHAQGFLSSGGQQQQFAATGQMQRQMQQFMKQAASQIGQSLQAVAPIQKMIDAANASGNPQQAINLARSYAQAQLNQSLINAQNLADSVDPIMHSFAAPGQLASQGNLQYLLSQSGPLTDTIRMFQAMLAKLDKMQANLNRAPHLASGGVVSSPTMALVGESGPEAIVPLARLQALLGDPAKLFRSSGVGQTIAPQWLSGGGLANFDQAFDRASQALNRQLDLGNGGAAAMLDRWNQVQNSALGALDWVSQHRRIDLGGYSSPLPGRGDSFNHAPAMASALHFNFGDIHVAGGMTQREIGSLFDRIEQEARARGYDITGRAALRRPPQSIRGPLTPAGFAR